MELLEFFPGFSLVLRKDDCSPLRFCIQADFNVRLHCWVFLLVLNCFGTLNKYCPILMMHWFFLIFIYLFQQFLLWYLSCWKLLIFTGRGYYLLHALWDKKCCKRSFAFSSTFLSSFSSNFMVGATRDLFQEWYILYLVIIYTPN